MDFLQPSILFALPLIGLPLLIHLINQRRHRTIHWAATMFLLQARRMARGMARLRYWLIMLARMLAVAGLIFAVARPMAAGWLGFTAGGAPELTIVLLDRSASMEWTDPVTGMSRRVSALQKLSELLARFESDTRIVLFDSASQGHHELTDAAALLSLPETEPTHASADIPRLLQAAADYIVSNRSGRTDIWLCTDLQRNDWKPSDGRWETLRTQLLDRSGVRMYVLNSDRPETDNLAVRVDGIHRRDSDSGAELVMDIRVTSHRPVTEPRRIPLSLTIDGAASVLELELTDREVTRNGHTIPIPREQLRGWGRVSLPHDANVVDNEFVFVYSEPAVHKTTIVAEDPNVESALTLVAESGAQRELNYSSAAFPVSMVNSLPLEDSGLLLWQAPLPTGAVADQIQSFVQSGRSVIFFPPDRVDSNEFEGAVWGSWSTPEDSDAFRIARWKTDGDLWANTLSGTPLPVGQLQVSRVCELNHPAAVSLAALQKGPSLLSRIGTDRGGIWFCGTWPGEQSSNLLENGIALYVMIHRALSAGAAALNQADQRDCANVPPEETRDWVPANPDSTGVPPSRRSLQNGVYRIGDRLLALNRPAGEDLDDRLTDDELRDSLDGFDYVVIENEAGSTDALASEIWRTFLVLMIAALIAETVLCMPARAGKRSGDQRPEFFSTSQP